MLTETLGDKKYILWQWKKLQIFCLTNWFVGGKKMWQKISHTGDTEAHNQCG